MAFLLPSSWIETFLQPGRLSPLRSANDDSSLDFRPQDLTILEIILVIYVFVGRQILYLIGFGNRFEIKTGPGKDEEFYELPELILALPFQLTEADLKQYAAALNNAGMSTGTGSALSLSSVDVPLDSQAQTCLVLSAFSEPAMLLLLSHHKSPVRPLGAVNVRNKFEVLRPDLCSAEVLTTARFVVVAALERQARKVKRGLEIDILVEIAQYEDPEVVIYRQVFTMLQFMKFKTKTVTARAGLSAMSTEDLSKRGVWQSFKMSMKAPRLWAKMCKDYNPIHISSLAAKVFGFRSTIAHGNHAFAIALAQLEKDHGSLFATKNEPLSMEVHFRKPIVLPATLGAMTIRKKENSCDLYIEQDGEVCVSASMSPAGER